MPEWFKDHGWMGAAAALLILVGASVAAQVTPKSLVDLDMIKLSPAQLIGLMMVLMGLLVFAGALSGARKASAEAVGRRKAFEKIRAILKQHHALHEGDNNYYFSRVRASAKRLRREMDELATDTNDTGASFLASSISQEAGSFVRTLENIERESGLNFDSVDITEVALSESHKNIYLQAHKRWQDQTRAISQGAASMVGLAE